MKQPYKVFTIYAREDAEYLNELLSQLRPLEIAGRIQIWSDREINPGVDWGKEIVRNLDTADIILILVSASYYNSIYIHEVELKYALDRHEKGEALLLPILVRSCSFGDDPVISRLNMLPSNGKPVADRRHWPERDFAWFDVVTGLKQILNIIQDAGLPIDSNNPIFNKQTALKKEFQPPQNQGKVDPPLKRNILVTVAAFALVFIVWLLLDTFNGQESADVLPSPIQPERSKPTSSNINLSTPTLKNFEYPIVSVVGGTFIMGEKNSPDVCPHPAKAGSFSIGKYEVTQSQWTAVMGNSPSGLNGCEDCPVRGVSWNDVQTFIQKLNTALGRHYRLPTETEWEYAARGGNRSRSYKYAGSNNLEDVAWYYNNSSNKVHPVGRKSPNEIGLFDMSGNVEEWCQDTYKPYPNCTIYNRVDSTCRVIRGSSYFMPDAGYYCQPSYRSGLDPGKWSILAGFRLAQD